MIFNFHGYDFKCLNAAQYIMLTEIFFYSLKCATPVDVAAKIGEHVSETLQNYWLTLDRSYRFNCFGF